MRARAVIDGQQVEIPVLRIIRTVGTQEDRKTGEWKYPAKYKGVSDRQIRHYKLKYEWERRQVAKFLNPHCQEKQLLRYTYPYSKPTQVDEEKIHRPTGEVLLRNSAK